MKHFFPVSVVAIALATQATCEMTPVQSWTLDELGYVLAAGDFGDAAQKQVVLIGPDDEVWRLPANPQREFISTRPVSDHTGDDIPELLLFERTSRSAGTLHVLTLAPGEITEIETLAYSVIDDPYYDLQPGELLSDAGLRPLNPLVPEPEALEKLED